MLSGPSDCSLSMFHFSVDPNYAFLNQRVCMCNWNSDIRRLSCSAIFWLLPEISRDAGMFAGCVPRLIDYLSEQFNVHTVVRKCFVKP